jgi:hypothetical protein
MIAELHWHAGDCRDRRASTRAESLIETCP